MLGRALVQAPLPLGGGCRWDRRGSYAAMQETRATAAARDAPTCLPAGRRWARLTNPLPPAPVLVQAPLHLQAPGCTSLRIPAE